MQKIKNNPTPEERPDLYDYYDCREVEWESSQAYLDAVLPEHVKKALADRVKVRR